MHHRSGILGEVTSRTHRSRRTTTKESLLTVSRETFPRGGGARGVSGTMEEQDTIVQVVFVQWTIVPLCIIADGERMVSTVAGE